MDKYIIRQLRDLPIEEVAERLGLEVKRHRSLCPFHEDSHPSLSFHPRRNTYRCFVCDASGDTIDLVMKHLHIPFGEACRWLADRSNVIADRWQAPAKQTGAAGKDCFDAARYEPYFRQPWLTEAARQFLFTERRLDPRVVRWCRLTSWRDSRGVNWLQTPFYDLQGKLTGVQNRNLDYRQTTENRIPRFLFPKGSRCTIYNLPVINLLQDCEPLYITEGCSDCWAMLSAGHKAVAVPSATLLSQQDRELLENLRRDKDTSFHIWPDNDTPGERLCLQLQEFLPHLVRHQLPPGCKDFSEYYLKFGKEACHD